MMRNDSSKRFSIQFFKRQLLSTTATLALFGTAVFLSACHRNVTVVSRTVTTGTVNAASIKGTVTATINIGRGGHSSCTFEQLPPRFTPGTLFSMA